MIEASEEPIDAWLAKKIEQGLYFHGLLLMTTEVLMAGSSLQNCQFF